MKMNSQTSANNWLILLLLSFVWGSSFILMKKGLISFSGIQVGALRISLAFLIFLPYSLRILKKVPRESLKYIFAIGLVGSFLPAFLYAIAQTKIDSAPTGILNSLTPLATYIWGIFAFGQQSNTKRFLGILVGLVGASVLIVEADAQFGINAFALLIVLATTLYGLSGNIAKTYLQQVKPLHITSLSFTFVGLPALLILFSTDFIHVMKVDEHAWQSFIYVAILSIVGTAFALILFWQLIQRTDAIFGSLTTYIIPVVAILWGLLDGEQLFFHQYLGFVLILVSVFLVKKKTKAS